MTGRDPLKPRELCRTELLVLAASAVAGTGAAVWRKMLKEIERLQAMARECGLAAFTG